MDNHTFFQVRHPEYRGLLVSTLILIFPWWLPPFFGGSAAIHFFGYPFDYIHLIYVGEAKAKELKAIFDISKSLLQPDGEAQYIKTPEDAYEQLKIMSTYEEERFCCIILNTKNKVIDQVCISKGSLNSSIVHPREVFAQAIRLKASGIILAHNHPSGDPSSSIEDVETTQRLVRAGDIVGIKVLDHLIIAANSFISPKEKGVM